MGLHEDEIRARHMLDAARKAVEFCRDKARTDLDQDELLSLALIRPVEVIGEAAKGVSLEFRSRAGDIPWREIAGTRDRLIHGYADVDLDIVWHIVSEDLPPVIATLERILAGETD